MKIKKRVERMGPRSRITSAKEAVAEGTVAVSVLVDTALAISTALDETLTSKKAQVKSPLAIYQKET